MYKYNYHYGTVRFSYLLGRQTVVRLQGWTGEGSIPRTGKTVFLSPKYPDRLWGTTQSPLLWSSMYAVSTHFNENNTLLYHLQIMSNTDTKLELHTQNNGLVSDATFNDAFSSSLLENPILITT